MNLRTLSAVPLTIAVALWLCATASATFVTAPEGLPYTDTIHAESEGATTLHGIVDITCQKSTMQGAVESQGAEVTAKVGISTLTFSECAGNDVTVKKAGSLEIHAISGGNGTVTSSGAEISILVTSLGITCVYSTNSTHIGTLTASATPEGSATLHTDSASIPRTSGSIFCGTSGAWTGSFKITTPMGLSVDPAIPADISGHFVMDKVAKGVLTAREDETDRLEWTIDGFDGLNSGTVCDAPSWGQAASKGETRWVALFRPTFDKCHTTASSENYEIAMNDCGFGFLVAKGTNEATEQTVVLSCPALKKIEIKHPKCTAKTLDLGIDGHQSLEGITYTKIMLKEKQALTVDFNVKLEMETEGDCGTGKRQGLLEGSLIFEGFDPVAGKAADLVAT